MRSLQMVMFMLCVVGGLFLLTQAPPFFMPARGNPAIGLQFGTTASRLLGAGLLALAAVGGQYLRAMYYSEERRLPNGAGQRRYFASLLLALALITGALLTAERGPNPDYRARGTAGSGP
ncbi:MAG TPA: hypothetical protein PL024_03285 [Thauera sp.]|nr:hypothetical protein [Thauera sp.]HRA80502.1 hypothetical protein [Thauera sp.]